MPHKM